MESLQSKIDAFKSYGDKKKRFTTQYWRLKQGLIMCKRDKQILNQEKRQKARDHYYNS